MAPSVRSTPLVIGAATVGAGGFVDLYTVPADRTAIVKDVRCYPTTITGGGLLVWQTPAAAVGHVMDISATAAGLQVPSELVWAVGLEGWVLRVYGPVGDVHRWMISGALLLGDPA